MPVHVHIPTRIRVDPAALNEGGAAFDECLVSASRRALGTSVDAALAPRAGFFGVRLHPPSVLWSGEGAADVPANVRRRVETRVAEILRASAEAAGVLELGRLGDAAPELVPSSPSEPVDPDRLSRALGLYGITAYDGRPRAVPVTPAREGEPQFELVTEWRRISTPAQLRRAVKLDLGLQGMSIPATGHFGVIFRRRGKMLVFVYEYPADRLVFSMEATDPRKVVLGPNGEIETPVSPLPPDAAYRLERIGTSQNRDEARRVYYSFYYDYLAERIRRPGFGGRLTQYETAEEKAAGLETIVGELIEKMLDRAGALDADLTYLRLSADGEQWLVTTPTYARGGEERVPENLDTVLLPLVRIRRRRLRRPGAPGPGEGGEGGAGEPGEDEEEAGAGGGEEEIGAPGEEEIQGFVYVEEAGGRHLFPTSPGAEVWVQECTSHEGEPSVTQLGADGERLSRRMEEIAAMLQIQPCEFVGHFAIDAARVIQYRALQVGSFAVDERGQTITAPQGRGNLGPLVFVPTASPAIQLLRHLASMVPLLTALTSDLVSSLFRNPDTISGTWRGRPGSWVLRFNSELIDALRPAIGVLFATTCRVLMIQLLRASHDQIAARMNNAEYTRWFELVVLPQLRDIEELKYLRNLLRAELPSSALEDVGEALYTSWRDARRAVVDALEGRDPFPGEYRGAQGTIVREGQSVGILDSRGTVWTIGELDWIVQAREGVVGEQDPLAKQVIDDHTLSRRFLLPGASVPVELRNLLAEMWVSNLQTTRDVSDSWLYAFRASQISRGFEPTVTGMGFALRGIHAEAHGQIGEFFRGDYEYARGLNYLFGSEEALERLGAFIEFTGLVFLAIVCPPLAIGAGIATGLYHREEARERERVYRSLIDPERVLTRAEVEAELFASELSLALSFIPAGGAILRTGGAAVRSVARRGIAGGAQLFVRYARRQITRQMIHQLERGFVYALAREIAEEQFEDLIIGKLLIEPAIDRLRIEFEGQLASQRALTGAR